MCSCSICGMYIPDLFLISLFIALFKLMSSFTQIASAYDLKAFGIKCYIH